MNKDFWKDYFSFSKKERIGVYILLFIITVFVILPYFFSPQFKKPVVISVQQQFASQQLIKSADIEDNEQQHTFINDTTIKDEKPERQLFYFDPNTLNETGWKKLGLRDKTIQTIINYRNKGGHFKQPEDIRKIYGLKKEEADALMPYIQIKTNTEQVKTEIISNDNKQPPTTLSYTNFKKVDINTATAEEFKSLPGIGDVLGNRIVKFRNAIHGFKSVEDIKRTYGLSDSTYQLILPYLTISDSSLKKIN
jgi:competence ComEA-like helix-hairpin-helix protein